MTAYTRIGSGLWLWEPFLALDDSARVTWLGLYTTGEAKRLIPGLWHGSINTMADAAHQQGDVVVKNLDSLLAAEMVEYDPKLRVLRMTQLPDAGESPTNGNTIRGWWTRFKSVPSCAVRDAHVTMLRWIMDEWSRENGKAISADHEKAWAETFGDSAKVQIPPPRKRGIRRLMDADTSTTRQPSLFGPSSSPSGNGSETLSRAVHPQTEANSVDNSDSLRKENKIRDSETLSKGFRKEPDQDQDQDREKDLNSPSGGGSGGGHATGKPMLKLVPPPADAPFTVDDLISGLGLSRGHIASEAQRQALQNAIGALGAVTEGKAAVALIAEYTGGWGHRGALDDLGRPGELLRVLDKCRLRAEEATAQRKALAEAMTQAGYKP